MITALHIYLQILRLLLLLPQFSIFTVKRYNKSDFVALAYFRNKESVSRTSEGIVQSEKLMKRHRQEKQIQATVTTITPHTTTTRTKLQPNVAPSHAGIVRPPTNINPCYLVALSLHSLKALHT
jgi:hypothetical protein